MSHKNNKLGENRAMKQADNKAMVIKYLREMANTIEAMPEGNTNFLIELQETTKRESVHDISIILSPLATNDSIPDTKLKEKLKSLVQR